MSDLNDLPHAWQFSWRAIAQHLPTTGLLALRAALASNSDELCQSSTTIPPELDDWLDRPVTAACAIGLPLWKGHDLHTVGEVSNAFHRALAEARLGFHGDPELIRPFLNWFDGTDRKKMIATFLPEVDRVVDQRVVFVDEDDTLAAA